jgi:hypothetical protein
MTRLSSRDPGHKRKLILIVVTAKSPFKKSVSNEGPVQRRTVSVGRYFTRVMHTLHNAEGHLLSLRSPLVGLPVTAAKDRQRQRILESPALLARHFQGAPRRRPHRGRLMLKPRQSETAAGIETWVLCPDRIRRTTSILRRSRRLDPRSRLGARLSVSSSTQKKNCVPALQRDLSCADVRN